MSVYSLTSQPQRNSSLSCVTVVNPQTVAFPSLVNIFPQFVLVCQDKYKFHFSPEGKRGVCYSEPIVYTHHSSMRAWFICVGRGSPADECLWWQLPFWAWPFDIQASQLMTNSTLRCDHGGCPSAGHWGSALPALGSFISSWKQVYVCGLSLIFRIRIRRGLDF